MFNASQYRAHSRQSSFENRLLWVAAGVVGVCAVAVLAVVTYVINAPPPKASGAFASAGGTTDGKGASHYTREWFQFNRNRKHGESAEDFVYANCMAASAYAGGMRSMGVDPFANVQATLDKHGPKRDKSRSAEESCREASRGARWERAR